MNLRRSTLLIISVLTLTVGTVETFAKSCLWKVTSKSSSLYLQGSMHILKADNYPLAPAIEKAYDESDILVFETDIGKMSDPATQQKLMTKALLPGSKTLSDELDAKTYQALSDALDRAGLPVMAVQKFKPWYATNTLTFFQLQKLGFKPQHGLDLYFHTKAVSDGKKTIGLESVDFQIDLFDSLSKEDANAFVTRALSDLELIEEELATLEKAWETGDLETMDSLISQSFEEYPQFHKSFVLDRNDRWLVTLIQLLTSDDTHMVIVGAGHLSGPGGLLQLLENKGYEIEQL